VNFQSGSLNQASLTSPSPRILTLPRTVTGFTVFSDRFVCVCSESNAYLKTKQTMGDYLERRNLSKFPAFVVVRRTSFVGSARRLKSRPERGESISATGLFTEGDESSDPAPS
jgi:hypothetical protein